MEKGVKLNAIYLENLFRIRDLRYEEFNYSIVCIRKRIFNYIAKDNPDKEKAYVIAMEICTIIDYLYCLQNKLDTYPCEIIIKRYGYKVSDLLDDNIFKYIFPPVIFEDGSFYMNYIGEIFIYKKDSTDTNFSCLVYCGIDRNGTIYIPEKQEEYIFCTYMCRELLEEEKLSFLNKIETNYNKQWDNENKIFKNITM